MLSKNQIRRIFQDIASNHWMIHSFGYGDEWELTETPQDVDKINYPILWVLPLEADMPMGQIIHTYQIAVFDLVQKGEGNEMEVESDTFKLIQDVVSLLNNQKFYPSITLDRQTVNVRAVVHEKYQDELSGHSCVIRLKCDYDANACAVPGDGFGEENPPVLFQGTFYETYIQSKSWVIPAPIVGDDIPVYFAIKQIKMVQVNEVLVGGSGTVTYNIYYAATKDAASPSKLWTVDRTASSYSGSQTTTFDNSIIPKGDHVWVEVSAVTGTITLASIVIFFNNKI